MPTQKFRVKDLRREDEDRVAARLREIPGVYFAVLDHGEECAEVDFEDDVVSLEQICDAVREYGYDVRIAG